jgi:RimJ/RimL family protein N-acetyltransferase
MIIQRYGVCLERVRKEHIEMVRVWRNDPKIRAHMFFKSEITPDMQRDWFNSINNDQNFYFLIKVDESYIGLISISSIDYEHKKAFAGLFIYDDSFLGTDIPVRSSLCILDVFFAYSNIDTIYAKVRDSNIIADQYNISLGFERIKKIELGMGYEYGLEKKNYFERANSLRQAAIKLHGTQTSFSFGTDVLETHLKNKFLETLYSNTKDLTPTGMGEPIID